MIRKKLIVLGLALFLIFASVQSAQAQEYGTIQATATVIAGVAVIGEHDLIFGTVLPDFDKTVDKADIGFAGEWSVQGENGAEITVDVTLPNNLMHQDSVATMPISFNNTDLAYDDGTGGGQAAPVAEINPNGPNTLNLGATGQMSLWIGGTTHPGITQTGGDYAADITLTVQYTGN
ncbi:MAG: hypothetical protein ABIJ45_03460 [Candidatus Zixiibacteriota bacterium]